jgi:DNA repair exonuclease SbcCD nuclease subunit
MRFRFIHAADLHLDTPFQGLARVSENMAALLRDASLDAFDRVVQAALDHKVAFVLFAGDIYDGEQRGVRAQLRFLSGLERLAAQGIRAFIVHGNHDPVGGWSAIRDWPAGVTVFGSCGVEHVPVEVDGVRVATVSGISYDRGEVTENLALRFPRGGHRDAHAGFRIGLLHCSVGEQPEHSSYSPCSLADLSAAAIDYWALGHIHRAAVIQEGNPWVVYAGNTLGRSAKPAEMGAKGVMLVEVDALEVRSVRFLPTDPVRFVPIAVDIAELGEGSDLAELKAELIRRALELVGPAAQRALLVRAELRGRGALHSDLSSPGAEDELLRDLRDSLADLNPPVWFESLRNYTAPVLDLEVIRTRTDFTSSVLARADALLADSRALDQLRGLLVPSAPAELLRRCGIPDEMHTRRVVEAAAVRAVEALESEAATCG